MKDPSCSREDDVLATIDPRVLVVLCLGGLSAPHAAVADGAACAPVVRADRLGGPWARALEAVRRGLAARDDIDHCVELIVSPEAGSAQRVRVVVRLATGGEATRFVDSPDDLGPTILALLLVPARPARPARPMPSGPVGTDRPAAATEPDLLPSPAPASPAPLPPPTPIALPRFEAPVAPAPTGSSRQIAMAGPAAAVPTARFEVGIAVGMRWQNALALGAGGFADITLGRWLIGVTGQGSAGIDDEVIQLPGPAGGAGGTTRFTTRTVELGVELGRRFALGPVELTGLVGPRVVMISRHFTSLPPPVMVMSPFTGETTTLRFVAGDATRAPGLVGGLRARWAGTRRLQLVLGIDVSVDLATESTSALAMTDTNLFAFVGAERPRWGVAFTIGGLFQVSP